MALVACALLAWMMALVLALEFPTRVGTPLLWVLDLCVLGVAWIAHVYFAVAHPYVSQVNIAPAPAVHGHPEGTQRVDISPVALALYPLAICAFLALLVASSWPYSWSALAAYPALAIPAVLLAAWVVRYTRPGR